MPDAVPKKRGPKTDVLEALLKRVDGLEAKLKEKKTESTSSTSEGAAPESTDKTSLAAQSCNASEDHDVTKPPLTEAGRGSEMEESPTSSSSQQK